MTIGLSANPGNTISIFQQILDSNGERIDGYTPSLSSVLNPSGTALSGITSTMTRVSTGLYLGSFVIPTGITSIGTYAATVSWTAQDGYSKNELYLVNVQLPFGTASVFPA